MRRALAPALPPALALACVFSLAGPASAQGPAPAPAERFDWDAARQALEETFGGPGQAQGIANETIGEFDLGPEIPGLGGRFMRMRLWTVEPGGVVPVHSHLNRPGMIYILEGEITEHRSDRDEPKVHGPGSVSIESRGMRHWWVKETDAPMRLLGFDVYQRFN